MMKRIYPYLLSLFAVVGLLGWAQAINITGTNSQNENSVVKVGYIRISNTDAITAFAGGGQGGATILDSAYNRVTTVATAGDSVKLPPCRSGASNTAQLGAGQVSGNTIGLVVWVTNAAAANSMNIYPQTGDAINALGANTAYAMVVNKTSAFICGSAGIWYSNLGA